MRAMIRGGRLSGKTVMLAASQPGEGSEYARTPLGGWDIDQAVIALARAVLAEGGELVFEGDPALTALVAMIAGEYQMQRFAESTGVVDDTGPSPVRVYRRGPRSDQDAADGKLLTRLRLIQFANDEPNQEGLLTKSSHWIEREAPVALVCVGGDGDVFEQSMLFAQLMPKRPIFALSTTGGAAQRLAEGGVLPIERVDEVIMAEVRSRIGERLDAGPRETDSRRRMLEETVVPFPIIMQVIVDRIANGRLWKGLMT